MSIKNKCGVVSGAIIGISTTFVLEVLGASGAIWGVSEAAGFRNEENVNSWRAAAFTMGALAFVRYVAKYSYALPRPNRHHHGFCSAFWHAVIAPEEAIQEEFFVQSIRTLLQSADS